MVLVREIAEEERDYWDREIQRFQFVHPLNAYGWGKVRSIDEWIPTYLVAERNGNFCGAMMILEKKLIYTPFSILYSPKGPIWEHNDRETLEKLTEKVKEIAKRKKAIFLRIDPNISENFINSNEDHLTSLGFIHLDQRWTFWNSPRDVSRIDLTTVKNSEEFFNLLDRDTRRCIRKAGKEGVIIESATKEEELKKFYKIFSEFAVGKGFMRRGYKYQKMLWDTFVIPGNGRLFLAKHNGEIIGGLICIMFGGKCLAMHMGTPYKYQKLQTYYAYVWESIKWAKERDCIFYSFRGVGTTPTQEYFKSKFLPEIVSLVGYYDLPFRSFFYRLFYYGEFTLLPKAWSIIINLRKFYHKFKEYLNKR